MLATLDQATVIERYQCAPWELMRLLRDRYAPLPVRIDGTTRFIEAEVVEATPDVLKLLQRRRKP